MSDQECTMCDGQDINCPVCAADEAQWKPGLPRGPLTQEMLDTFEVYFSPGGMKWHRHTCRR